jgi:transcriptional regulator of arginine metabolism
MKSKRQELILKLIAAEAIDTQEDLLNRLKQEGLSSTQATISRDIRELGIHKVRDESGRYRYVSSYIGSATQKMSSKFSVIFAEAAVSIDYAQNIVVVKCHTGMANAACATFDAAQVSDVIGTLSGDDTFFIVTRTPESAQEICERLRALIGQ